MKNNPTKVLILGSGGLRIGQAGEFDYSGSQAIKALKEEKIRTVLINPNIATVQTSEGLADKIYFLPLEYKFVSEVIKKEKPDGILLAFGGQTALNCGIELWEKGVLKKFKVKVLGTSIETIKNTEDRKLFVKKLDKIGAKTPTSIATTNLREAASAAKKIGYPVMVRAAYALGGRGSGICKNEDQLIRRCAEAFLSSPQVLVEEWLGGWKEVEYEVVRDRFDNCITVCNMENFDPLGIHTGESIVVAPSQTLTNSEYHKLREISIKVIRHLKIVGECNIQFALDPHSKDYRIIEVNARLSRSSALASKATGYPLAFIAAKLALGYSLFEIENKITKKTMACFEPALDYVVVKIPRWDLVKFKQVDRRIGSEMKSVGEVMSIGRKFEEALQKALRMINIGMNGFTANEAPLENAIASLKEPTDNSIFAIADSLKQGYSPEDIHKITQIDKWFLYKLENIINCEKQLKKKTIGLLDKELLKEAKQYGFSDFQIAKIIGTSETKVRQKRKKVNLTPSIKQIDTLAAEYPAVTNYLYLTYNGEENDVRPSKNSIGVLGSGAYRIGSSVEFDWCCVNAVTTSKDKGYSTIMINNNPETVSTDYDICDRLYFDEITLESILDICEFEKPQGLIISMGGQVPNNLAIKLDSHGIKIFGTSAKSVDEAEDRHKFSKLLDNLNIDQPEWEELTSIPEAIKFANNINYPVLTRPSYVLSGAAMNVSWDDKSLEKFLKEASVVNPEYPVVITKFIENSKEIEIDAVANKGKIILYAISEHIEKAGVHSGDATIVFPAQRIYAETMRRIKKIAKLIAKDLKITGPFNIQFLAYEDEVRVIECNLRASRSFPFVSKIFKVNFIDVATRSMLGENIEPILKSHELDYVGVKAAQFSFRRLKGADPISGVEMASTGEVACLGSDLEDAFLKAYLSVGFKIPKKNVFLSTGPIEQKAQFLKSAKKLVKLGYKLYATKGTAKFLKDYGVNAEILYWSSDKKKPNGIEYIRDGKIDLVINIPKNNLRPELQNDYLIRRTAVDFRVALITETKAAIQMVESLEYFKSNPLEIKAWDEY